MDAEAQRAFGLSAQELENKTRELKEEAKRKIQKIL